jgi:hypothetical protein
MLTFIGPGATGKTRLSLQVAEAQLTDFKDGIWFIELAQLMDSAYIISRAASVFNLRDVQGVPFITMAIDYLRALRHSDLDHLYEYASDPEFDHYVLWEHYKNIDEARENLNEFLDDYEQHGVGAWGI